MGKLIDLLFKLSHEDMYPMHMPGHKRQMTDDSMLSKIRSLDITEIDGFDDLHSCDGVLRDLQNKIKLLYKSQEASILINGSTCGILAAISACTEFGDKLIMARNSHKSAYNAVFLRGLDPAYIYPDIDEETGICKSINPKQVKESIEKNPDAKAIYITSPTYEGVVSDVKNIAKVAHEYGIPLIVDAAHGAHLGVSEEYDNKCNTKEIVNSADIVIQSLHKTLPALTQSAIIHYNDEYVNTDYLKYLLTIYQSSSPSYILMAGIENCIDILENKKNLFKSYIDNLNYFYEKCNSLKHLKLLKTDDIGKLVILTNKSNITGKMLYRMLCDQYMIQPEMASLEYVICMTSILDTKEGFNRLANALITIDEACLENHRELLVMNARPKKKYCISEAFNINNKKAEIVDCNEANGRISGDFIYAYPPGIPIVVPGEIIDNQCINIIETYRECKFELRGLKEGKIRVLNE